MPNPLTLRNLVLNNGSRSSLLNGLVAYWKLSEASDGGGPITRYDSQGSNHLTDINTCPSGPGKLGSCASFTRANTEELQIDDNSDLSTGNIDFTLSAWIYLMADTNAICVSKSSGDATSGYEYAIGYVTASKKFAFTIGNGTNIQNIACDDFGAVSLNAWYLVIGWHDKTLGKIYIQVNNTTATGADRTLTPADTNKKFRIGGNQTYLTGRIGPVGFWKRLLSVNEKASLWNNGKGIDYPFRSARFFFQYLETLVDSVDMMANGTIIAGSVATIKKSVNGGATWTDIYTVPGSPTQIRRVFVDSRDYIYVSGYGQASDWGIYRSIDGGANFTLVLSTDCAIWAFDEDASGNLYAGDYGGTASGQMRIWKSTDGGANWVQKYSNDRGVGQNDHTHDIRIDPANGYIYATTGDTTPDILLRSTDAGENWDIIYSGVRLLPISFKGGYVYIGADLNGADSKIYRFQDTGGASVVPEVAYTPPLGYGEFIFSSAEDSSGNIYFGAADGTATRKGLFKFDGVNWSIVLDVPNGQEGFHWLSRHNTRGGFIIAGFGALRNAIIIYPG
jgi:photosystem II stability/assembly factor-like uncharacterized protein